jgi:ABC-2 type transport system ATP-binding protein
VTFPLVRVSGVSRSFGDLRVLDGVDLDVAAGSLVALLGPSGAGKTTLVRMIAGADVAPVGEVLVDGRRMPQLELLPLIGYMAQSDALYFDLSGRENLEFFGELQGLTGQTLRDTIARVVALVDMADSLDRPVLQYSGGMKRRLSLAITMLHDPKVLILDEPTVGLDPVLRKSVWDEFRKLADDGRAVLVTTHVMDEAGMCDLVCMLRGGRIIAQDTPQGLIEAAGADSLQGAFLHFATMDLGAA